ncbi:Uma2 family endonuclease [Numidum massiliense]|uniref:Uma2 family endonuclease n=1 Tax=Numidum massiliense TaxID=1522315 RepID=UPI0009EBC253|nr:Uma2 family endonuclease [Numidum massiliense]
MYKKNRSNWTREPDDFRNKKDRTSSAKGYDVKDDRLTVKEGQLTYDDYATLPDDAMRYELVAGTLEELGPSPSPKHQFVSVHLLHKMLQTCEANYVVLHAPLDVILSPHEVRQPDLVMIRRDRLHIVTKRGIEGSPDLVVEILSPATAKRDKHDKLKSYASFAIPEYWIIDPQNELLEQYVLPEQDAVQNAEQDAKEDMAQDNEQGYTLHDIYTGEQPVRSTHIPCVQFSVQHIMGAIPELPNA